MMQRKIPCATSKTRHSQNKKNFFNLKNKNAFSLIQTHLTTVPLFPESNRQRPFSFVLFSYHALLLRLVSSSPGEHFFLLQGKKVGPNPSGHLVEAAMK